MTINKTTSQQSRNGDLHVSLTETIEKPHETKIKIIKE